MSSIDPLHHRKHAARLANAARDEGFGDGWFEPLYQWAEGTEDLVPWADLAPHPLLVEWVGAERFGSVAVVGCGLGDDAEFLAARADSVWAFDVSPTAIDWARRRFPASIVEYEVASVFELPSRRFDLVVEIYTLQALPPESRPAAIRGIASLVGSELVVVSRWRTPDMELAAVPWPLLEAEFALFDAEGLRVVEDKRSEPGEAKRLVLRR